MHKIDFLKEDDIYNPFYKKNYYSSLVINANDNLYNAVVDYLLHKDLVLSKKICIEKSNIISKLLLGILDSELKNKHFDFKASSKFYLQSIFAKMHVNMEHSSVFMYFQLIGIKTVRKSITLSTIEFLKDFLNN